jgi:flagellar export protein FliJ
MGRRPFRLERILDWKTKEERMKELEKTMIERKAREKSRDIEGCLARVAALGRRTDGGDGEGMRARDMAQLSAHLRHLSRTIHGMQVDLRALIAERDGVARQILEVRRMKRALESLRERHREAVAREEVRAEISFLDEIGARKARAGLDDEGRAE